MVFRLDPKILEDGVGPESFHMVLPTHKSALAQNQHRGKPGKQATHPVLDLAMSNGIMKTVT